MHHSLNCMKCRKRANVVSICGGRYEQKMKATVYCSASPLVVDVVLPVISCPNFTVAAHDQQATGMLVQCQQGLPQCSHEPKTEKVDLIKNRFIDVNELGARSFLAMKFHQRGLEFSMFKPQSESILWNRTENANSCIIPR